MSKLWYVSSRRRDIHIYKVPKNRTQLPPGSGVFSYSTLEHFSEQDYDVTLTLESIWILTPEQY